MLIKKIESKSKGLTSFDDVQYMLPEHFQYSLWHAQLIRTKEYKLLIGNSSKAKKILKWEPKINIKRLVKIMVEEEKKFLRV